MSRWAVVAVGTTTAVAALAAAAVALSWLSAAAGVPDPLSPWDFLLTPVAALVPAAVGSRVVARHPASVAGWSLIGLGAAVAMDGFSLGYSAYGLVAQPGSLPVAHVALAYQSAGWVPSYLAMTALALYFPDGRLPSRRWRPVAFGVLLAALAQPAGILRARRLDPPFEHLQNPLAFGHLSGWAQAASDIPPVLLLASVVAGAAAIVTRFRRSHGVERQQMKWLAYAIVGVPAILAICIVATHTIGEFGPAWLVFPASLTFLFGWVAVHVAVSGAVGIAILRHKLYDIDRLINRTVVYAMLTLLLMVVYAVPSLILGVALGRGSAWVTATATLAAALCFQPLRRRIQTAVDWHFDRGKYNALRSIEHFLDGVRQGRASPEHLGDALRQALRDPTLELLFWLPESQVFVDQAGHTAAVPPACDPRARTPLEHAGTRLGLLLHDRALLERRDILTAVLAAGELAVEIARLRVEVRVQLAEVEASRARIVLAGYKERQRLERDIHDGAQQRLVSLGVSLRLLQRSLPMDSGALEAALDDSVEEVARAIADLRELARGVRPARLDEGLAAALRNLARGSPLPVRLDLSDARLPSEIEAAAYFVASEALTNAIKHSGASSVAVRTIREDGHLRVRVEDDGKGGARLEAGSGLAGLLDRVDAHGGRLRISSQPGAGTVVEAELPCAS